MSKASSTVARMSVVEGETGCVDEAAAGMGAARRSAPDSVAMLQRTSDGFTFPTGNGEDFYLSVKDISKAKCLMTSYEASSDGDVVPLGLTIAMLLAWRAFHLLGACDTNLALDVAVLALEAADFLGDDATLPPASALVARLAFPIDSRISASAKQAAADPADREAEAAVIATQVVEALPEHLALLTLRAALSGVPPDLRRTSDPFADLSPEDLAPHRRWQPTMLSLMALLPERHHRLVLLAHNPTAEHDLAFSLPLPELRVAAPLTRAAAHALPTHLTALSLIDCSWQRNAALYGVDVHRDHAATVDAVNAVFAPLAALTALESFRVELARTAASGAARSWMEACAGALGGVLREMQQLTRLHVRAWSRCGRALGRLAPHLPALRALRALDLSRGGLMPMNGDEAPLRAVAAALQALSGLTHLNLSRNWLGDRGWEELAPALAATPLLSLELEQCELFAQFSLPSDLDVSEGGDADVRRPPGASFATRLLRLRLSGNHFPAHPLEFLAHTTQLKELSLDRVNLSAVAQEAALRHLHAPNLQIFEFGVRTAEARSLAPEGRPEATMRALVARLRECPRLRAVKLGGLDAETLNEVAPVLLTLPDLRDVDLSRGSFCISRTAYPALARCTGLTALRLRDLSQMVLMPHSLEACIGSLVSLRCLEIGAAPKSPRIALSGAFYESALAHLTRLTRLCLVRCKLAFADEEIAVGFKCMPVMRDLVLCGMIDSGAVAAVAEALRGMPLLSVLVLESDFMREGQVLEPLAPILPELRALRVLRLGTGLPEEAVQRVCAAAPRGTQRVTVS